MKNPSQILTMRAPASDWTGLARTLEQRFGKCATAAYTHNRFATGNHTSRKCSDTPTIILGHGSAGNDAACNDPAAISEDDAEAWAQHALAANGFGDGAITETAPSARPTSYDMYHAARAHRSLALGEFIIAAIKTVEAYARQALVRQQQRRQARSIYDAIRQLDDRSLRDLGLDRSEIRSLAAEMTGEAACTRVRALQTSHGLPK